MGFHIAHVTAVASKHPFYSPSHTYTLRTEEIPSILSKQPHSDDVNALLSAFPIKQKHEIYSVITRLLSDMDPRNTFRHGTYISLSGGGGGLSVPIPFLTDIKENQAQRRACGELMRQLGVLNETDCVLSMHTSGNLYRALDLTIDTVENAGATVLPAGHLASPESLLSASHMFLPTVLGGDTSQILRFASFIESTEMPIRPRFSKIMYTSESITRGQRAYIESVLGVPNQELQFISSLASAEMGPIAIGSSSLTGHPLDDSSDFIFDTRNVIFEVLPLDFEPTPENCKSTPCTMGHEGIGILVVTSLQRLRNPLVRYLNGDIGSVHALPDSIAMKISGDTQHLRILRLYGRDLRHSFEWAGDYFEFSKLQKVMMTSSWGVLRWQLVLEDDPTQEKSFILEARVMRTARGEGLSEEDFLVELKEWFLIDESTERSFRVKIVDADGFVRSATGNKIVMFVDQRKR